MIHIDHRPFFNSEPLTCILNTIKVKPVVAEYFCKLANLNEEDKRDCEEQYKVRG
jgi:hypothetical protein